MTEIDIERKPERRPWGWILVGILVVALAIAGFFFYTDAGRQMMEGGEAGMEGDPAEMMEPPGTERPPPAGGEPR